MERCCVLFEVRTKFYSLYNLYQCQTSKFSDLQQAIATCAFVFHFVNTHQNLLRAFFMNKTVP
jgi:hypothetical protein